MGACSVCMISFSVDAIVIGSPATLISSGSDHSLNSAPAINSSYAPSANSNSICKLYTSGNKDAGAYRGTGSVGVTSGSYDNDTSLLSGAVYMREWNYVTFKDRLGTTREASEYFIMASSTKHNKIFLTPKF